MRVETLFFIANFEQGRAIAGKGSWPSIASHSTKTSLCATTSSWATVFASFLWQTTFANAVSKIFQDMPVVIFAGAKVKLLGVPDWLIHDLPKDEQDAVLAQVGKVMEVEKIDDYGYVWLCFGETICHAGDAYYTGHSFAVTPDFLERVGCGDAVNKNS